jgi:pyrimidine-specific ribonucleoside hydrolase
MIPNRIGKSNLLFWCTLLIAVILTSGCGSQALSPDSAIIEIQTARPIILDVDMAHDDMFSILLLLTHPNVDVKAITVSGTGETHCEPGVANALGLVALSGQGGIPIACGRETPLAGDHTFPIAWRQAADDAYGVTLPDGGNASPLSAPDLITDILLSSSGQISIVAVGPLTNIAEAIQTRPEITSKIDMIYIMGGALEVEGNVGQSGVGIQNKFAEWNIYIDPLAANVVQNSGIPVILVPLDATQHVPVTLAFYNDLGGYHDTLAANFVYEILTANLDFVESGGFQFWDTLTAAIFTDEGLATFEEVRVVVVEDEGPESGYTKLAKNGISIRVAMSANKARFEQLFITVLTWED